MTIYVMDLFSVRQIGMSLGSDENDKLQYCMFRGTGNIVVQLAIRELLPTWTQRPSATRIS